MCSRTRALVRKWVLGTFHAALGRSTDTPPTTPPVAEPLWSCRRGTSRSGLAPGLCAAWRSGWRPWRGRWGRRALWSVPPSPNTLKTNTRWENVLKQFTHYCIYIKTKGFVQRLWHHLQLWWELISSCWWMLVQQSFTPVGFWVEDSRWVHSGQGELIKQVCHRREQRRWFWRAWGQTTTGRS